MVDGGGGFNVFLIMYIMILICGDIYFDYCCLLHNNPS